MQTQTPAPMSPCPTTDPEHAAREMAHWFTLSATMRAELRPHANGDLGEYVRNGGTVEALQAKWKALACNTCGMSPDEMQGHKFCPDC